MSQTPESKTETEERNWYTAQEVAGIFRVAVKTVGRWQELGRFAEHGVNVILTPGGHRRFLKEEIHELFEKMLRGELYPEGAPNDTRDD